MVSPRLCRAHPLNRSAASGAPSIVQRHAAHERLAESLGVLHEGWVKGFGSSDSHDQDDCLRNGDAGEFIAEVNKELWFGDFIHAVAFRLNRNGHIYIVERTGLEIGIHNEYRRPTRLTTVA